MSSTTERVAVVEEIARNLADALLDPGVKDVALRHEKRQSLHAGLVAAIEALAALAYACDSYVELLSLSTKTKSEEADEKDSEPVQRPPDSLRALNAKLAAAGYGPATAATCSMPPGYTAYTTNAGP